MRTFVFAAAAATVALASSLPAAAQDGPFTGPRVGATLGWDGLRPGSTEDSNIRGDDQSADGLLYGGEIGYDVQINRLVIGAEASLEGSTGKVNNSPVDTNDFGYGRVKAGRDIYVGGRVGVVASPTTLVYAKAGYTNARLDLTRNDTVTTTGANYNLDGFRVGAGVEKALTPNSYAKIEYRYSNYGDARLNYPDGASTGNFSVDTDRHQVAVGAGIRF